MKIEINNHRKTFAIQQEFNHDYPNLRMEFYEKPSKRGGPSSSKLVKGSKNLSECRTIPASGFISILSGMTVGELKQNFNDVYGLKIDIYQLAGQNNQDESPVNDSTVLSDYTMQSLPI